MLKCLVKLISNRKSKKKFDLKALRYAIICAVFANLKPEAIGMGLKSPNNAIRSFLSPAKIFHLILSNARLR